MYDKGGRSQVGAQPPVTVRGIGQQAFSTDDTIQAKSNNFVKWIFCYYVSLSYFLLPETVENLINRVKAWEAKNERKFFYDKVYMPVS
jgi:hypothetical protein